MNDSPRGMSPREVASYLRVGVKKVRLWIRTGSLKATNVASSSLARKRLVILPHDLAAFISARQERTPQAPKHHRNKTTFTVDYYP